MSHQLDDRAFVTRLDPMGMLRLTEEFPAQCRRALTIARETDLPTLESRPSVALLTGLGGSAAGGDFTRAIFEAQGATPFFVNRDYHLPNFVGLGDLVFVASYSGNTEETLTAYQDAKTAGARIVCVTSGGKLSELAKQDGIPIITIPGGQPPRTALGFMLVPVLVASEKMRLIPSQNCEAVIELLEKLSHDWSVETPFDSNEPKKLAQELHGKLAVLYGLGGWQGVIANRWKGQINENSKNMVFANQFPELNHNEILGWVKGGEQSVANWTGVFLEDGSESPKMKVRAQATEKLVSSVVKFHRVRAQGVTLLEKMMGLAHFGDYVSLYLAALNGVDPGNMDSIEHLKAELARVAG